MLLDPAKMLAHQVAVDEIESALLASNIDAPGGKLIEGPSEVSVRTMGRILDPAI